MFGGLNDQERATLQSFMEDSGRVLALVSADNTRFQEAIEGGIPLAEAAHLQYYLHRISFIDQANLQYQYGAFGETDEVIRSDSSSHQLLVNCEIFFSRLRYLLVAGSDVFIVSPEDLSHWKRLVEQAWTKQQADSQRAVKRSKVRPEEWVNRLLQLEREAEEDVPNVELARVEAKIADLLWETSFIWALAVAEEAGDDKLADKLFAYGAAATCATRFWFDSEQDETTALRHLNLLRATAAEESLQRFHRAVASGSLAPTSIGTVVGFVARLTANDACGWYERYITMDGPRAVASALDQSLIRILGPEMAQVAAQTLLDADMN